MAWNAAPATVTYLATSRTVNVTTRVDITDPFGNVLTTVQPATGSTITEDENATFRRIGTLAFDTNLTDGLIPAAVGDLLHPLTGNELRPYTGIIVPGAPIGAEIDWIPMGVYQITGTPTQESSATGGSDAVTLSVNAADRSSVITRAKWSGPFKGGAGLTVDAAIMAGLKNRWPGTLAGFPLTFNFAPTTVKVPAETVLGITFDVNGGTNEPGSTSSGNNPWADFQAWAAAAAMELLFDRQGIAVLRPIPTAGTAKIVVAYNEGDLNTATALTRELDASTFCNITRVIGTGLRVPAIQSVGTEFSVTASGANKQIVGTVTVPVIPADSSGVAAPLVTQATVTVNGGGGYHSDGTLAYRGGSVVAIIPVTAGTVLQYIVGAEGVSNAQIGDDFFQAATGRNVTQTGTKTPPTGTTVMSVTARGGISFTNEGDRASEGGTITALVPVTPANTVTWIVGAEGLLVPNLGLPNRGQEGGDTTIKTGASSVTGYGGGSEVGEPGTTAVTGDATRISSGISTEDQGAVTIHWINGASQNGSDSHVTLGGPTGANVDAEGGGTDGGSNGGAAAGGLATLVSTGINSSSQGSIKIVWQANVPVQGPPVQGIAQDLNPNSPGYVKGILGPIPQDVITSALISTVAEAEAAAAAALIKAEAVADETSVTASSNPLIDAGDACSVIRARMKLANSYIMSAITTPIGIDASGQTITNRAASIEVLTGKPFVSTVAFVLPKFKYGPGNVILTPGDDPGAFAPKPAPKVPPGGGSLTQVKPPPTKSPLFTWPYRGGLKNR